MLYFRPIDSVKTPVDKHAENRAVYKKLEAFSGENWWSERNGVVLL